MIEFKTADGEMLTLLHDGAAVKGAPGGDRASLFIGGHCHALLHGYEDLVKEVEGWIYGPDKPDAEENHQTQAAQVADVHTDEGNVGHGAAAAAAGHVEEAPGAGTEQQPA